MKNIIFVLIIAGLASCNDTDISPKEKKKPNSEAYEALQFLGAANAYPNTDIPPDAYGRAWDQLKSRFTTSKSTSASLSWTSMGPTNVGGRAISIAIDPADTSIIWMGSASGGLWKSETGGIGSNAWQYVETGFPVLGVGAVAINPSNSNELFIGTGETYDYGTTLNGLSIRTTRGSNGIGILKSTDGGITWTHSLNWMYNQNRGVWDIIYDYTNPLIIYAATTEGIYKTTDGGVTWNQMMNEKMVMDLAIDPFNPSKIFAGVGNLNSANKGVYRSTDAGVSWQKLGNGIPATNNSGRISIDIYKQNSEVVMAFITNSLSPRGLYRSEDGGDSWVLKSNADIASFQGWYAKCLKIDDSDSSIIYAGGVDLFKSSLSGASPSQITFSGSGFPIPWPDLHDLISNPLDENKFYLLTDAGLYRSNNKGQTWFYCADGYNASQFYHGSVSSTDSTVGLGGLQDRNTRRYNGTTVWLPVLGGDGTYNAIDQTDDYIQYSAYQYLAMSKSSDRGFNFNQTIFGGISAAFVAPFAIAPSDNNRLYTGDRSINVSTDQGFNWTSTTLNSGNNPVLSIDISHYNADKLYFATVPNGALPMKLYKSTDGALSYVEVTNGLPDRYPRDISVDPADDDIVFVAFSGFGTGHIYKTIDGGLTWNDVSTTLPDIPFHTVLVAPYNSSIIFAGSDYGVFASTDAGLTWQSYNTGLPMAVLVFDLQYSPSDHALVAFTHGNGAYKSKLHSLVTSVHEERIFNSINIYPTLTTGNLNLSFQSLKSAKGMINIYDLNGRLVQSLSKEFLAGWNELPISVKMLNSGNYLINFICTGQSFTRRFMKM